MGFKTFVLQDLNKQGVLFVFLICMACCGQELENRLNPIFFRENKSNVLMEIDASVSTFKLLSKMKTKCVASKGYWNPGLLSCICPSQQLFNVDEGCQNIILRREALACLHNFSYLSREVLQKCVRQLIDIPTFQVSLDLSGFSDREIMQLTRSLDKDPASVIQGASFFTNNKKEQLLFKVRKIDNRSFNMYLNPWLDPYSVSGIFATNPILDKNPSTFIASDFVEKCEAKLGSLDGFGNTQRTKNMCGATADILTSILGLSDPETQTPLKVHLNEEGQNCFGGCAIISNSHRNGYVARYQIHMIGYVPMARIIYVAGSNDSNLNTFISATGKVEGFLYSHDQLSKLEDPFFVETYSYFIDSQWNHMDFKHTQWGNRRITINAFKSLMASSQNRLPTDGKYPMIGTPLKALMIDSGLDIRVPGLLSRLQFHRNALLNTIQSGQFTDNILSYRRYPLRHAFDFLTGDHGASVATIIAAGLPNLQLDFINMMDMADIYGDAKHVRDAWSLQIEKSGARVVNMSVALGRITSSCQHFMGTLFGKFPEVLFVVGMGNQGARSPTGTCPAGIAHQYPNVVTVAGTDAKGHLDGFSNYGRNIAMVAAPYEVETIDVKSSSEPISSNLVKLGGTSMSAALVSHAALRLMARHPSLKPAQIISILMNACKKTNIDVACRGEIDFGRLEGI